MKTRFGQRWALVTAIAIGASSLAGLAGAFTPPNPEVEVAKVTICHRTNANNNPYVANEPDASGDVSGHSGHVGSDNPGPVWNPTLKALGIKWGDIIPPFKYGPNPGDFFDGLNWTVEGQAIYANDCVPPGPPVVQVFGTLALTKAVVNPDGVGVPASFTLNVACDDLVARGPYVIANTGNVGSPVQITDIEAGSTCIVTEDGAFNPTFDPPAANTTGVLVIGNQTVAVTVTNTFAPPAADVVTTPRFTG